MKKLILSVLALSFSAQLCHAQWNTSSTQYNYSLGNVVIGSNVYSPAKFSVFGSGFLTNLTNGSDQDLNFSVTPSGAADKYSLISPSVATNLAFGVGNSEKMRINSAGNLGIATTMPLDALQIGNYGVSSSNAVVIPGAYNFEQVRLGQTPNGDSALEFVNHTGVAASYGVKFLVDLDHGLPGLQLQYAATSTTYSSLAYHTALYMDNSGVISIGTVQHPVGYKFAVGGNMIAEAITVKLQSNWPDYVFERGYHLKPLNVLEKFIKDKHHLPNMPSTLDVNENGIDLGNMNQQLLKKVEELTLYLIIQQKQINTLKRQMKTLKK